MNDEASPSNRWKLRDFSIATALFAATALWVFWQNSRVAVLWDLGYLLDTSHRIAAGQIPYRGFSLVHPPVTFLIQAVIERIFGRHYECVIAYAAFAGGIVSVLVWRIILSIFGNHTHARLSALLLSLPLPVLSIYSVYPHPIYDADATLAVLASILLLQHACRPQASGLIRFAAGASCVFPLFVKQNIGLPFLIAALSALMLIWIAQNWKLLRAVESSTPLSSTAIAQIAAGGIVALGAALLLIQLICGLGNYFHWTVQFAAQRRLPAANTVLSLYSEPTLLWTLPLFGAGFGLLFSRYARRIWTQVVGVALITAPYLTALFYLLFEHNAEDRADRLLAFWPLLLLTGAVIPLNGLRREIAIASLTPFLVLAAIHGTFLSQEVWGSTYAIWPLLMLLTAYSLAALPQRACKPATVLAGITGVTLLVCGGLYSASLERLDYIYNSPNEPLAKATLPALHGMAARGAYLPDFEQLVRFADAEIPESDGILLLPGEEPFFYATGRVPQFPVVLFDHTTDPYTPEELMTEADRRGIRWVIVKTRLQSNEDPLPDREQIMQQIGLRFQIVRKLDGYDVYRRR
jgi:hypothetical protein